MEDKKFEYDERVLLFHKLAGYYKWTWEDFLKTPYPVLKQLSRLLDEKANDQKAYIGYEEVGMLKNLIRLFQKKDGS